MSRVRNGYERPGPLLLMAAGILAASLQDRLRVAWALLVAVVGLAAYAVHVATRPRFLLLENGDFFLTEEGDRLIL